MNYQSCLPTVLLGLFGLLLVVYLVLKWLDLCTTEELTLRGVRHVPQRSILTSIFFKERPEVRRMKEIATNGKIFGFKMLGVNTILCQEVELVQLVMNKEFTSFTNRRRFQTGDKSMATAISIVEDEQWKRIRSVLAPAFSTGKLKHMIPCISETCKILMSNIEVALRENQVINIKQMAGAYTMDTIMQVAYGVKVDSLVETDHPVIRNASKMLSKDMSIRDLLSFALFSGVPWLARWLGIRHPQAEVLDFFQGFALKIIQQKREEFRCRCNFSKASNFIEFLLEAEHENELLRAKETNNDSNSKIPKYLTPEEMLAQSILFLFGAYDTTSSAIALTCHYLAVNLEVQNRLHSEITQLLTQLATESDEDDPYKLLTLESISKLKYLTGVVNETLRLHPPAYFLERRAGKDIRLETADGKTRINLKRDDIFHVAVYAMHRDPRYFPEPDLFKPERFLGEPTFPNHAYMPFGNGPRNCIAKTLAIVKVHLALIHLIRHYRLSVCTETKVPPEFYNQADILIPKDIYLKIEKR